jgi:hypothetical protein
MISFQKIEIIHNRHQNRLCTMIQEFQILLLADIGHARDIHYYSKPHSTTDIHAQAHL